MMKTTIRVPARVGLGMMAVLVILGSPLAAWSQSCSVSPEYVRAGYSVTAYWNSFYSSVTIRLDGGVIGTGGYSGSRYVYTSGLSTGYHSVSVTGDNYSGYTTTRSDYFYVSNPQITVTPAELLAPQTAQVAWSGFSHNVIVDLYNGGSFHSRLETNTPGTGSTTLSTSTLAADTDWRIKVTLVASSSVYDYSSTFTVRRPDVASIPEPVFEGDSFNASWSGFFGNVDVEIWRDGAYWYTDRLNTSGTSEPVSTNGWEPDDGYQVKVVLVADPAVYDFSGYFTLYDPVVSAAPASVAAGETVSVTWSGFPGNVNIDLYKGAALWKRELTNTSSAGTRNLNTAGWEERDDYRARVIDYNDASNYWDSNVFAVTAPAPPEITYLHVDNLSFGLDDWVKNGDSIRVTATYSGVGVYAHGDVTADLSGLGGSPQATPNSGGSTSSIWVLTGVSCTPADGPLVIEVTVTNDSSVAVSAADTITADNTAPAPLATGLTAAAGHQRIDLVWQDPSGQDADFFRVYIRYALWNDYPEFDDPAPGYPASPTSDSPVYAGTGTSTAFSVTGRYIVRFAAFVLDRAGNFSPAAHAAATSYILGDVGSGDLGPYDGLVTVADHTGLASAYGLDDLDPLFKPECDVGPTDDAGPTGLPLPDGLVGFEDLVVFAMNYETGAKQLPPTGTDTPRLAWTLIGDGVWALRLLEPCADLKALRVAAELPDGVVARVEPGGLIAAQTAPVFLANVDRRGLDAGLAVLGAGVGLAGGGELLRVILPAGVELSDAVIEARGLDNAGVELAPEVPAAERLPDAFRLAQNVPNPFNPRTTIRFDLPEARRVRLSVYTLRGRRVATLLDEPRAAGVHEVVWTGRDDSGRELASGTYVYRIAAGPHVETRKMILMK